MLAQKGKLALKGGFIDVTYIDENNKIIIFMFCVDSLV